MQRKGKLLTHLKNSLITLGLLAACASLGAVFDASGLEDITIYTLFVMGITLISIITADRVYGVIGCIAGILLFNFLYAVPRFSFQAWDYGYPAVFIILITVTVLVSSLSASTQRNAFRTRTLLTTDQLFLQASGTEQIVAIAAQQLQKLLGRPMVFYMLVDKDKPAAPQLFGTENAGNKHDWDAAVWAQTRGEPAGAHTQLFPQADYTYLPIRTPDATLGVAGVAAGDKPLPEMEHTLLASVLSECALALERDLYDRRQQEAAMQMKHEKLRADLLRSISHDLRTPLTGISGNASLLEEKADYLSAEQKRNLTHGIVQDAQWLLNTVENLLSVTRMEDGRMNIRLQPEMMAEVVAEAVERAAKHSAGRRIETVQEDDMLMARIDARLILQVLLNLIDNAVKYTPPGSAITIRTLRRGDKIAVEVADTGNGVPDENKDKIFEMFYTTGQGSTDGRRGLGLGLALCKAIVAAHGGEMTLRDNAPHGSIFTFTLPEERVERYDE